MVEAAPVLPAAPGVPWKGGEAKFAAALAAPPGVVLFVPKLKPVAAAGGEANDAAPAPPPNMPIAPGCAAAAVDPGVLPLAAAAKLKPVVDGAAAAAVLPGGENMLVAAVVLPPAAENKPPAPVPAVAAGLFACWAAVENREDD